LAGRLKTLTRQIGEDTESASQAAAATTAWRHTDVRKPLGRILREMAPGLEQCMYCGEEQGTDIDHFDPITRSPLRAFDWLNHLLACTVCNSHYKRDRFPLDEDGNPLLIDPTAEDPSDHLLLTLSLGHYEPLSRKGEATIEICNLNRPLLERGRIQGRRVVELCLKAWKAARQADDTTAMHDAILTVREQPFADVCQAMLRQAQSPGAEIIFSDTPALLSVLRLLDVRTALMC
jgi:hypothetical protein